MPHRDVFEQRVGPTKQLLHDAYLYVGPEPRSAYTKDPKNNILSPAQSRLHSDHSTRTRASRSRLPTSFGT